MSNAGYTMLMTSIGWAAWWSSHVAVILSVLPIPVHVCATIVLFVFAVQVAWSLSGVEVVPRAGCPYASFPTVVAAAIMSFLKLNVDVPQPRMSPRAAHIQQLQQEAAAQGNALAANLNEELGKTQEHMAREKLLRELAPEKADRVKLTRERGVECLLAENMSLKANVFKYRIELETCRASERSARETMNLNTRMAD